MRQLNHALAFVVDVFSNPLNSNPFGIARMTFAPASAGATRFRSGLLFALAFLLLPALAWAQYPVRDSFSSAGALSANWTTNLGSWSGNAACSDVSSGIAGTAAYKTCEALWTGDNFTSNQYAQAVLNSSVTGATAALIVRGNPSSGAGYLLKFGPTVTTTLCVTNGGNCTSPIYPVCANFTKIPIAGTMQLAAVGNTITAYYNGTACKNTLVDTTYSGGLPGIAFINNSASSTAVSLRSFQADCTPSCVATLANIVVLAQASSTQVAPSQTTTVTATVNNDLTLEGVSWSLVGPGALSPTNNLTAVYTAPALFAGSQAVITATSNANQTKNANVALTLTTGNNWQAMVQLQNGMAQAGTKPANLAQQGYWVVFNDAVTGAEIWQLDGDESPGTVQIPGVLNRTPWNVDGSRFVLTSTRCVPGLYCGDTHDFVYTADGSFSRPIEPFDPTRQPAWMQSVPISGYTPFDRVNPNLIYWATGNDTAWGYYSSPQSTLYAINLGAGDMATNIVSLPNPTRVKHMQSYAAEDNILMVQDVNPPVPAAGAAPQYVVNLSMVNLNAKTLLYSYPINFGLTAPGHSQSEEYHIHDIYFRRDSADTYIFNYGPMSDVGESVFFEMPLNGNAADYQIAFANATTATPYYSHPAWNSDGSLVAYGGESVLNDNQWGVWVRNHNQFQTLDEVGSNSGHLGWDGYDPDYLVFDGWTSTTSFDLLHANPNGSWSNMLVKYPPNSEANPFNLMIGPAQSPDATKVMFSIPLQMVSTAPVKTFVAVDHRPFAPHLQVVSTSPVQLQWTPYVAHREVQGYRVYRSSQPNAGYTEVDNGLITGTTFTDTSATSGSVYYYAVTAQENSGLESNTPALVSVVVGGGSSAMSWPAGAQLMETPPAPPSNLTAASPSAGIWTLNWTGEPGNVRYYNIYYSSTGVPEVNPFYQVASVPAANTTFTYWLANPSAPAVFGIVAVDRQGNQSAMTLSR
jgi:hypothetical protein